MAQNLAYALAALLESDENDMRTNLDAAYEQHQLFLPAASAAIEPDVWTRAQRGT